LAEGIFWLLDRGWDMRAADEAYWAATLDRRRRLVDDLIRRMRETPMSANQRARILDSLCLGVSGS
jgi:hypothetical protein